MCCIVLIPFLCGNAHDAFDENTPRYYASSGYVGPPSRFRSLSRHAWKSDPSTELSCEMQVELALKLDRFTSTSVVVWCGVQVWEANVDQRRRILTVK